MHRVTVNRQLSNSLIHLSNIHNINFINNKTDLINSTCISFHKRLAHFCTNDKNILLRAALGFEKRDKSSSSSSQQWFKRHTKDEFVKKSQKEGYRARSAYKLLQIQEEKNLIKPGARVVECGGAPGAWTQVISQYIGDTGKVVSCDLLTYEPVHNAVILANTDFTCQKNQQKILSHFDGKKVDLILSDMAPNHSGLKKLNQDATYNLVLSVIKFALTCTAAEGALLTKIFNSSHTVRLTEQLGKVYREVEILKPASSRKDSSECYIYAAGFTNSIIFHNTR